VEMLYSKLKEVGALSAKAHVNQGGAR